MEAISYIESLSVAKTYGIQQHQLYFYSCKLLLVSNYSMYPTTYYHLKSSSNFIITEYREYFDPNNKFHSKHYWLFVSFSIIYLSVFFVSNNSTLSLPVSVQARIFRRFLYHCLPSKRQLLLLLLYTLLTLFRITTKIELWVHFRISLKRGQMHCGIF